jgi:hypothetical protein
MANNCFYQMQVQGAQENVDEFIKIIKANYYYDDNGKCNVDRHFWRVFEACVDDEYVKNCIKTAMISGDCAWSVYSCMCDGKWTYQDQFKDDSGTTLKIESERLHLAIEVYSEECGCAFMEHFVFVNGEQLIDECVDWNEYPAYDYESVEELNEDYGTNFTQEEFEGNEYLQVGGMDWDFSDWTEKLVV